MARLTNYLAAAIQLDLEHGAKEANIRRLEMLTREASAAGARLIVAPEMATLGSFWTSREHIAPLVEPIPGPTTERFGALARELDVHIVVGMAEVDPATDAYYNAAFLVGPHGLIGRHRKVHSFLSEPLWAVDGDLGFQVWDTPLGRLGLMICMDANYPESGLLLARAGADVLLLPANWTEEACPAPLWITRAHDSRLPMVCANRRGGERGFTFTGGSAILDSGGAINACAQSHERDQVVIGEIDLLWPHEQVDRLPAPRVELYRPLALNRHIWNPPLMQQNFGRDPLPSGALVQVVACEFQFPPPTLERVITTLNDSLRAEERPCLIVLPEYSFTGAPQSAHEATAVAETADGLTTQALAEWSAHSGHYLVAGIVERDRNALYSTLLLLGPAGVCARYRKTHLTGREPDWLSAGDSLAWADTPIGRVGLLAGSDLLRPEPIRVLAIEGADVVCVAASPDFPAPITRAEAGIADIDANGIHWHLARVRAAENDVYVAFSQWAGAANRSSSPGGIFFGPVLFGPPAVEALASPSSISGLALATLELDTRARVGNPLRDKPSLQRRLPGVYAPLQREYREEAVLADRT